MSAASLRRLLYWAPVSANAMSVWVGTAEALSLIRETDKSES